MRMNIYKIECDLEGYNLTAVVACDSRNQAISLAGFDGELHSEQEVTLIGDCIYSEPTLICCESL